MSDRRRPGRITTREFASQTGMDDFDEEELTNADHASRLTSHADEQTLDDPHGMRAGSTGDTDAGPYFPAGIEVAIVREHGVSKTPGQWRAYEVWTGNRVYAVDGHMTCFGVMDRATGKPDPNHAFIGARLMGGEKRDDGALQLAFPLPTPGTEAVFQLKSGTKGRYGHTSRVEKVVVRIRVTMAQLDNPESMWEEITSTFRKPG
jgi:hypothetical protein